jgi:hypothetical protein
MNDDRNAALRNALRALVRAALASGYGGHQQQFDTVESLARESWGRLDDNEKSAFSAGVGVERAAWITKLRDILGEETAPPTLGADEFLLSVFYTRSPDHLLRRGQWMADMGFPCPDPPPTDAEMQEALHAAKMALFKALNRRKRAAKAKRKDVGS